MPYPSLIHLLSIDTEALATIDSIVHNALLKSSLPGDTELLSELLLFRSRRVEIGRLAQRGLMFKDVPT